jgi:GxxExxY protein
MAAETGLHADLTRKIIAAMQRVHRVLGGGFLEKVYENALRIELEDMGLSVEQRRQIDVYYRGRLVGVYEADLIVEGLVIIELKAVEALVEAHEVQLVNYLRATRIEVGLLVNFGTRLDIRRRIFTNDRKPPI